MRCLDYAFFTQIADTVSSQMSVNLLMSRSCCKEFFSIRKINAINAGMFVWWAADQHMHLLGTSLLEYFNATLAGGASYDRVVDADDPLSFNQLGDQVELDPHIHAARYLRGL